MKDEAHHHKEELRWEAIERVEQEARDHAATPAPKAPRKLAPQKVKMEKKVFQQRTLEGSMILKSENHTKGLVEAIQQSSTHEIEPIDIWWSGMRWIVVDGHHRLRAYRQVRADPKRPLRDVCVPVRVFEGTFDEAFAKSAEGNTKDKLIIPEDGKSNVAWRFTCRGYAVKPRWKKDYVAMLSGRSRDTITNMRRIRRSLIAKIEAGEIDEVTVSGLMELSWEDARRLEQGEGLPTWDEEQLDKAARAGAYKLRRTFGGTLIKNPDMFARILKAYHEDLPQALMQSEPWWDARRDMQREEHEAREEAELEDAESDF
ncbi:MAG: ParB/RepB/Spo0J family partition protein [Thermohalobaculum sp.]